jgi:hypothetical protein
MNNILTLCYPGGGGGNWLRNLVYCLEHDILPQAQSVNYHDALKSKSILLTHDRSTENCVFFNTTSIFNVYLNIVIKLRHHDQQQWRSPLLEQFQKLANETSSKLFFLDSHCDLDWNLIFLNPAEFAQTLFNILDQHSIVHSARFDIVQMAIDNYKNTCIDPVEYLDNFDSVIWLGWCNGINKHLFQLWPINDTMQEMQQVLLPKRDFFLEYTNKHFIKIK